jgi:ubiquinone/menaquinone biosynthesis C-methylase UbiE
MSEQNRQAKIKAANTYNAASDHFDDETLAFWSLYGRKTVERLNLKLGSAVLDVACGTGASVIPAAQIVGPSGKVIAVDLAEKMLEIGRKKAANLNLNNIEFRTGDMENLGYQDNHFDAVVCVFGVFFVPNTEGQVRELWRMVRPGGKLAITTWGPRLFEPAYSHWKELVRAERSDLYSAYNPWDRITDVDSVRRLMIDGGVTNVDVVPEEGRQVLRLPEDWWTIVIGSGLRWTIDQLGKETSVRVREANLKWVSGNHVDSVETNVIYAIGIK